MPRPHPLPLLHAACASLAACAPAANAPRIVRSAISADTVADRLFFGRSIPGGGMVTDSAWSVFLAEVVTPRFPDGLTVWQADGQWLEASGVLARESSTVVEVAHPASEAAEAALRAIAEEYKRRFRQEAVLRVTTPVRIRFYE
jgi:hypothetical protein